MKKFKFRLQKVLEHRTRIKDECATRLRARIAEHSEAVQKLQKQREAQQELGFTAQGPCNVETLTLLQSYGERLMIEIARQITLIAEAEQKVVEAREEYVKATTDARALELLRDKRKLEYNELVLKHESDQIDEMTTQRSGRHKERL